MASDSHASSLQAEDVRKLGEVILELNDLTLPDDRLFERFASGFDSLVRHSSLWIACSDVRERMVTSYMGPWAQQAIELAPAFGRNVESHPQFMALCQGMSSPVDAVSDYISLRKWRATGMYNEVVKQAGAVDQFSASLPIGDRLSFSIVVNREQWGITLRERTILELLTPHVIQAWRMRSLLKRILPGEETLDESRADFACSMVCDSLGNIVDATDSVARWIDVAFPGRKSSGPGPGRLPEIVRRWLRKNLSPDAIVPDLFLDLVTHAGIPLRVSVSSGCRFHLHTIIFRRIVNRSENEIARLTGLGVSHRQAEILLWVARGKTNEEIACILGISIFTVKAHLRAIFGILMVENRNSASAAAWTLLRGR